VTDKPLTHAQRRAAEKLLDAESQRLWNEYNQHCANLGPNYWDQARAQARDEWYAAHPDVAAAIDAACKKARAIEKRANKAFAALAEQFKADFPHLKGASFGSAGSYTASAREIIHELTPQANGTVTLETPWDARIKEIANEIGAERQALHAKITDVIESKRVAIWKATVGDTPADLYTLPPLADLL
jgi:hypothetical protein